MKVLSGGEPARCHQHRIGSEGAIASGDVNVVACVMKGGRAGIRDNRDPFALQHAAHTLGDVGIESRGEGVTSLEQGDLGTESGEHLGKLQADESATHDDEPRRQGIDVPDRGGVMDARAVGTGNREGGWVRSGVDDDRFGVYRDLIGSPNHLDVVGSGEAGFPVEEKHFALQHGVVGVIQLGDEGVSIGDG